MSQYNLEIISEIKVDESLREIAERAIVATLLHQDISPSTSLTLLLADDVRLQQLNQEFMDLDRPTDVLSFPAGEIWDGTEDYLGDVAISVPMARRQAMEAGHDLEDELSLLAIHGTLHLLGYDHASKSDEEVMWAIQGDILGLLNQHSPQDLT